VKAGAVENSKLAVPFKNLNTQGKHAQTRASVTIRDLPEYEAV
jgi:hypothetical protein